MKNKIKLAIAATVIGVAAVLATPTPAEANLWAIMKGSNLEEKEGIAAYKIPTEGIDVRVYEWNPVGAPNTVCVMAFGSDHPVGLQCVPMEVEAE